MAHNGLKIALQQENPLQIAGTINALSALLAKKAGFRAIYLSGAGVSNASLGLPDIGLIREEDILCDVGRITRICDLPLLVDLDTGFGEALPHLISALITAGAAGVQIEDQIDSKKCGHLPNKTLVSADAMCRRLEKAQSANTNAALTVIARTDALQCEGLEQTLYRIDRYITAGAEIIFFEGAKTLAQYETVAKHSTVPVLANITEFGVTPLFTREALKQAGISLILYPLSAFRAMNHAAEAVYRAIREQGTQQSLLHTMQTREALYQLLNYQEGLSACQTMNKKD